MNADVIHRSTRLLRGGAGTRRSTARRGLSLIEMMIALTISVTLLSATLAALDAMFKGYSQTTESASTHMVSRLVVSRLLSMIRTGEGFGPVPATNVFDSDENPLAADYFQFVAARDAGGDATQLIRVEYRFAQAGVGDDEEENPPLRSWSVAEGQPDDLWREASGELWFVRMDLTTDPPTITQENPLLTGVRSVVFTMHYDVGPQLTRATVDLVVEPNDSRDLTLAVDAARAQTFRLVGSAAPRNGVRTE